MGADGRTPTEAEEFSALCMSLARKSCSYFSFLPDEETLCKVWLWDLPRLQIIRWPCVHWNTFRSDLMQDIVTAVLRRDGTQKSS